MFYSKSVEEYELSAESQLQDLLNSYVYSKVIVFTSEYIDLCIEAVVCAWSLCIMFQRL